MRGRTVDFNRPFIRGMLVSRGKRLAHRPLCDGEQAEASASEHVIFITSLAETITACFSNPTSSRRGAVLEQLSGSNRRILLPHSLSPPSPLRLLPSRFHTVSAAALCVFRCNQFSRRVAPLNGHCLFAD